MIVPGSANPLLMGQSSGYNLTNSLRFRSSASAYLNRTFSSGNRKTFTWSGWVKRGALGTTSKFFSTINLNNGTGDNKQFNLTFTSSNTLEIQGYNNASYDYRLITSQVFRDPSAWYHLVVAFDTTQATSSNRIKVYVNGVQVTAFSTSTYPTQNLDTLLNSAIPVGLGAEYGLSDGSPYFFGNPFDGYMTEINFIDGQALTPSSFGQTSSTTGVWQPKKYSGTYGTNGFYLPFTDNSALTSGSNAGLGKDFSGNGNYWNTNNISITSGSTYDSMTDVPTLTSATASNYCVINPIDQPMQGTVSNGNLTYTGVAAAQWNNSFGSFSVSSGKWYWEVTVTSVVGNTYLGASTTNGSVVGTYNYSLGYYSGGSFWKSNGDTAYATGKASYTAGDVIGFALDVDSQTIEFFKNNVSQGTITSIGAYSWKPALTTYNAGVLNANFGQRPFTYTPPTGYVALNTYNLPTPTVGATSSSQANKYFDVVTYAGNGTTQNVTGLNFSPDFVWVKGRNIGSSHQLYDTVRGVTKQLLTDGTNAELTTSTGLTAFNSDGFTGGGATGFNGSGYNFVGWCWDANGTGVTNTAGSITSTVSANTTSGFSVVTWTGNGSSADIGHGLGVAPKMIIAKSRTVAQNWAVYHASIGNNKWLQLNSTSASITEAIWQNSDPTSTVFKINGNSIINTNGSTSVAYCFAEVAGFSKFGSYTGNGSADGPFVFTGFRPRYLLVKITNTTGNWLVWDAARNTFNVVDNDLRPNLSNAESNETAMDFLSNGFKLRSTSGGWNGSGNTYIYMAFAEFPTKFSLAR